jgi:hypothetical protein
MRAPNNKKTKTKKREVNYHYLNMYGEMVQPRKTTSLGMSRHKYEEVG